MVRRRERLTLFMGGDATTGAGVFFLKIYLIKIPCDCSSLTKYVQRRFAGNADGDFLRENDELKERLIRGISYENGVLFGSSIVR